MRLTSLVVLTALIAVPVGAETAQQRETAVWQAFKDKNAGAFKGAFTSTYEGLYDDGPADMAKELHSMSQTKLGSFAIHDFRSRMLDPDDMLTTYNIDVKGTEGSTDISGRYWAASVWHRAGGKWLSTYHSEIKARH